MVTAREQFEAQEKQLGVQFGQLKIQEKEIRGIVKPPASKMQLYRGGLAGRQARRKATVSLKQQKEKALQKVTASEKKLKEYEIELEGYEKDVLIPYEKEVAAAEIAQANAKAQYEKDLATYNEQVAFQEHITQNISPKLQNLSYSVYFKEWKNLTPEEQKYFTSPIVIKESKEYKQYKKDIRRARDLNRARELYMLDYIEEQKKWGTTPTTGYYNPYEYGSAKYLQYESRRVGPKPISQLQKEGVIVYDPKITTIDTKAPVLPIIPTEPTSLYEKIDVKLGGILPFGKTPTEVQQLVEPSKLNFIQEQIGKIIEAQAKSKTATKSEISRTKELYQKYQDFQSKVSEKIPTIDEITKPISDYILSKKTFSQEELDRLKSIENVIRVPGQIGVGIYSAIQEKPVTTAVTTATFAALGPILQTVGWGARATGIAALTAKVPTITKVVGTTIKVGLPVWYGSTVVSRVMAADNPEKAYLDYQKAIKEDPVPEGYRELSKTEFFVDYNTYKISKGETFGRILGGEVIPMGVGGFIGAKYGPKISDYFRTKGRIKLPSEKVITQEVLLGKTRFPEIRGLAQPAKQKFDIKMFKKGEFAPPITKLKGYTGKGELIYPEGYKPLPFKIHPGGYHATGMKFWKGDVKVTRGESEFKGLYTAPSISTHFLRAGTQKYSLFGGKLFEPYGKPGVAYIQPTRYIKGTKGKLGEAYIPGIKPEIEAIVTEETILKLIGGKYYVIVGGRRVPIDMFKTISPLKGLQKITTTRKVPSKIGKARDILSSYKITSTRPIITPGSYLLATTISYKPTGILELKPSYFPSKIKEVTPSYINSIPKRVEPSYVPSYKPIKTPSYVPSEVPSKPIPIIPSYAPSRPAPSRPGYPIPPYMPSYVPSYKPSYTPSITPKTTLIPPILVRKKLKKKKVVRKKQLYQGQTKVKRKWTNIGTRGPKMATVKRTRQHVDRNIAASVRVIDVKTKKAIKLMPTRKFRRSQSKKLRGTVLVEKRKYRLDTKGEGRQIAAAPKKKRKTKKRRNIFFK